VSANVYALIELIWSAITSNYMDSVFEGVGNQRMGPDSRSGWRILGSGDRGEAESREVWAAGAGRSGEQGEAGSAARKGRVDGVRRVGIVDGARGGAGSREPGSRGMYNNSCI